MEDLRIEAAIFAEGGDARLEAVHLSAMRDDEILVRIVGAGVCHTDLVFSEGFLIPPYPIILGHEGSGVVERVGSAVTKVEPGDHVVLTFMTCGTCPNCVAGDPAACDIMSTLNSSGHRHDGTDALCTAQGPIASHFFGQSSFATYSVANQRNVVKVRKDAPLALLGPLGCGIQTGAGATFNVLRPAAGESFVIFGAGSVGLSALMAAKILGCDPIIAVEPNAARRELALSLGARHAFDPATETDIVATLRAVTGRGIGHAVDTSGIPAVVTQAIQSLCVGGAMVILSANSLDASVSLSLMDAIGRSLTIHGSTEGGSDPDVFIPRLVDLIMDGSFPLDRLVQYYPFAEVNAAMHDTASGRALKPILLMDDIA